MASARGPVSDRRRGTRHSASLHAIISARIRPGYPADVLDVSVSGLHLETAKRLLPGTTIDLYLERADGVAVARARVCRCTVAHVSANRLIYRASAAFEVPLAWFVEPAALVAALPDVPCRPFPEPWVADSRRNSQPMRVHERPDEIS